jgi:hypothetical protein
MATIPRADPSRAVANGVPPGFAAPPPERMGRRERLGFGVAILTFGLLLLTQFLALWPAMIAGTSATAADQSITLLFGAIHLTVAPSVAVLAGVMLAAMVGAIAYEASKFSTYALRGELTQRAEWWYVLRPLQAAALAAIVFFALQGGLIGAGNSATLNAYGLAAIGGLVGLFTLPAMNALGRAFEAFFGKPDASKVEPRG